MRRFTILALVLAVAVVMTGCGGGQKTAAPKASGPSVNLAMKYAVGQTGTYKLTSEVWRTAKFEGPELSKEPKLKNGKSGNTMTIVYTQDITAVAADGTATARITIKELAFKSMITNETSNEFDSTKAADKDKPLAKLIGQTITMKLSPDGKAEVVDAAAFRGAITEGSAKDLVANLFTDKELARLFTVSSLPEKASQKVGSTWSMTEMSPKSMMVSKNFEKQYTVAGVSDGTITVDMKAVPSSKPVEKGEVSNQSMMMSMFGNMMESKENFSGKTKMTTEGSLKAFDETLDSTWFATDPQAKPDAEPDKITIGYQQKRTIEKVK